MANQHKHPVRGLRGIPNDLWAAFDEATQRQHTDRSSELRRFMEWYVGRNAELPQRSPTPRP
ncbi:hypothetical protein [Streptomyces noursei]|uniref:hypothetical protein n=1 Tax=Streptomyces noursei TaxID=1971 RepID=UPI0011AFC072|nr:hypothetical protein [Streptomyces noursei]